MEQFLVAQISLFFLFFIFFSFSTFERRKLFEMIRQSSPPIIIHSNRNFQFWHNFRAQEEMEYIILPNDNPNYRRIILARENLFVTFHP